jgi:lysophospholipase L1-like esterase
MTSPRLVLLVLAATFAAHLAPATPLPRGVHLFEAESIPGAGDAVRQDASARGGAYATNPRPWNPVVKADIPAELTGQSITVWARVRGGPFQLKGTPGGKQADLKWHYAKPADWEWVSFGAHSRAQLGDALLIIRADKLDDNGGIDALVLASSPAFDPATLEVPDPSGVRPASDPSPTAAALPPITVPSGGWFPPGWVPRRTAFRDNLAADQGAVVFLGDSITQGFKAHEAFSGLKTANRGISGDLAGNLRHRLEGDVLAVNPSAVVLLMGTNDAKDGKAPAAIVADLRAAAEKIHAAHPDIPVIVCRLLPRAPRPGQPREAELLPGVIPEVNQLIDRLPAELPWLRVADTFTPFARSDASPKPEYLGDGVHPNAAGNAVLAEALRPILREALRGR